MTAGELNAAFRAAGAIAWGGVPYATLSAHMDDISREKAEALVKKPTAVLVAVFPYFTGETAGNLSVYARGQDYHAVLRRKLDTVCDFLRSNYIGYSFLAAADSSPLPEREAAWLSGLGLRGKNRLFILPPYGSYVFLGTILTNATLDIPSTEPAPECMNCGKCLAACPTGALGGHGVCLSDLTQKKGDLTGAEIALLKSHPYIWGCDLCQNVCPYNQSPKVAPLPEFEEAYLADLTADMLEGLTNKAFAETFGHRAFAWRGAAVLRRNLYLKRE